MSQVVGLSAAGSFALKLPNLVCAMLKMCIACKDITVVPIVCLMHYKEYKPDTACRNDPRLIAQDQGSCVRVIPCCNQAECDL